MNVNNIITPFFLICFGVLLAVSSVCSLFRGQRFVGSGISLAGLVRGKDPASSCYRALVVQVTFFLDESGVCRCWIGVGWRGCRWGSVCFTRHAPQMRPPAPPARTPRTRRSLSLSSCEHSLVSRFLSVVCLLSLVRSVLLLLCFCALSVLSCLCLSSVSVCVSQNMRLPHGTTWWNHSYYTSIPLSVQHPLQQSQAGASSPSPIQTSGSTQESNGTASPCSVSCPWVTHSAISPQVQTGPTQVM